jgi:hypothetical protein
MKKRITVYGIIWAICLGIFNVISFVTPNEINGVSKFNGSFWVGYVFITVAFVGQLICAIFALKSNKFNKLFYNISLITVSYAGLTSTVIIGGIFMAINALPYWIGIILCVIILGFNAISVIKASAASSIVSNIDEKVKAKTLFIRELTVDADALVKCASNDLKKEALTVYDAIRYSDPMSSNALISIENQIKNDFIEFSEAIRNEDLALATEGAKSLLESLNTRNQKCKLLK